MNFQSDQIYHIYNRSFNKSKVYFRDENYSFFLDKIQSLTKYCEILAYCLMPDHFHLLVFIPQNSEATTLANQGGLINMQVLSRKIGTILSSYTQAINKQEHRSGSLFQPKTKAKPVESFQHSLICFHYIHQNPSKSKLINKLEDWVYSSFNEYYLNVQGLCNKNLAYALLDISPDKTIFYNQSYQIIESSLIQELIYE